MNSKPKKQVVVWITLFSVAMGLLETAVVVYLRELYYPEGFSFPLKMMPEKIITTEILREAATLTMLIGVGTLAGRTRTEKFGYFIYSFAVWDIFYYIFLKLLLDWPESLFTWDILFLIPITWVGPVICPILLSIAMIILSIAIIAFTTRKASTKITTTEWSWLIIGSIICIASFTDEYSVYILTQLSVSDLFIHNTDLLHYAINFIPTTFPWNIFLIGFLMINIGVTHFIYRNIRIYKLITYI